jgi:hypothetical protein
MVVHMGLSPVETTGDRSANDGRCDGLWAAAPSDMAPGAHWGFSPVGLGQAASARSDAGLGHTVKGVGPFSPFPKSQSFSNIHTLQVVKYKKVTSITPKICKLGMVQDEFEWNNLPFWKKSKFATEFELKI